MTEEQKGLLLQARDSLGAAKLLMKGEYPGYAASRAYYTMFYIATVRSLFVSHLFIIIYGIACKNITYCF